METGYVQLRRLKFKACAKHVKWEDTYENKNFVSDAVLVSGYGAGTSGILLQPGICAAGFRCYRKHSNGR